MKASDITITRNHEGAYVLSAMVRGYLVTKRYYGYTKREAIKAFKGEV
jgi:hypothetical protein